VENSTERMAQDKPSSVKFFYEKGKFFRVAHVDGALGGLTPTGDIFVSIYNQRSALPKIVEQNITPEGKLGAVVDTTGKQGIFREMEIGLVMTPDVANQIADFLKQHARAAQESAPPRDRRSVEKIQ
jgi:hypothetical protein